jgi:hypothetical protein
MGITGHRPRQGSVLAEVPNAGDKGSGTGAPGAVRPLRRRGPCHALPLRSGSWSGYPGAPAPAGCGRVNPMEIAMPSPKFKDHTDANYKAESDHKSDYESNYNIIISDSNNPGIVVTKKFLSWLNTTRLHFQALRENEKCAISIFSFILKKNYKNDFLKMLDKEILDGNIPRLSKKQK